MIERAVTILALGATASAAVAAVGCRDAAGTEPAAAPAATAAVDPWAPPVPPAARLAEYGPRTIEHGADPSLFTLQDAGAPADRRVLRYKLRAGMRNDFEIALETMTYSAWHPRVTMFGSSEITAIDDQGMIHVRHRVTRIVVDRGRSDGAEVAQLQAVHDRVVGLSHEAVFDARGNQQRETITVPHADTEQEVIDHLTWYLGSPDWLPEEAVGVGARWSKTQTIDRPDDVTARTATWELVGHRGDVIEIRGTASDSGSQDGTVSTSSRAEFSATTDLATLVKSGHGLLRGEYRVRYGGELRVIQGGTESVQHVRPAEPPGTRGH